MEPLLNGHNPEERIVAVHQIGNGSMRVFKRSGPAVTSEDLEFFPFFFITNPSHLEGCPHKHWVKELSGGNYYKYLCAFTGWSEMWDAVRRVLINYNAAAEEKAETYHDLPIIHLRTDAVQQFLIQSGRTLFKGMAFDEVHRLQLDIETYWHPGARRGRSARGQERILLVALSDNQGWETALTTLHQSEERMLRQLVETIREKDPDVIEGHNIIGFDLPYLLSRCKRHELEFAVGRDGSVPRAFDFRSVPGDRSGEPSSYDIAGRHVIDTLALLQSYDASRRELESYGLKYAARHFGLAAPDRVYVGADEIASVWDAEPEKLIRYAMDDVRETRALSALLSGSLFHLTQMLPSAYGTVARMGSSAKIEALLLREYIRQKHSVPRPELVTQMTGGYTDLFCTGLLGPVVDVDVESLYPSIMIRESIAPSTEPLGVFPRILRHLTQMRIDAKRAMRASEPGSARSAHDAMQSAFKILINSFYGYLGYTRGLFNDSRAAERVTQAGQKILRGLIGTIVDRGGTVVEVDTDGIFFVPPPDVLDEQAEEALLSEIVRDLPEGINLVSGGRFRKMLSYKMKNYALLGFDGKIVIKGSSLASRSLERFGRTFVETAIECLLHENIDGLHELYVRYRKDIAGRAFAVGDFAKTDTMTIGPDEYQKAVERGERNRTAVYEVALASNLPWRAGDRLSYYITGTEESVRGSEHCKAAEEWDPNFPDENVAYYLRRLDEFASKFEPFFTPSDHHAIFSVDDLFGFSSAGIRILTKTVEKEKPREEEEESEPSPIDLKIWLDSEG